MRGSQESMNCGKLVDERQGRTEGVHRRSGWFRIGTRISKRVHIVQILDSARERHPDLRVLRVAVSHTSENFVIVFRQEV